MALLVSDSRFNLQKAVGVFQINTWGDAGLSPGSIHPPPNVLRQARGHRRVARPAEGRHRYPGQRRYEADNAERIAVNKGAAAAAIETMRSDQEGG